MGLFDFLFRRNKPLALKEGGNIQVNTVPKTKKLETNEKFEVHIFSNKKTSGIEYSINILSTQGSINIGTIKEDRTKIINQVAIKDIAQEIQEALSPLSRHIDSHNLRNAKKSAIIKLKNIANYRGFELSNQIKSYISNYGQSDKSLNESGLSIEEEIELEETLNNRINRLNQIETPEEAYEDKEALIDFIKKESAQKQDDDLYLIYLKLEEKRVWEKIKRMIVEYCTKMPKKDIDNTIFSILVTLKKLDSYEELQHIEDESSVDTLEDIKLQIKERNAEDYIKNIKSNDFELAKLVNHKVDIPEKAEILQFLYKRIASLGQLSDDNKGRLSEYVTSTDFKVEDNSQIKQFLLLVSKIEKQRTQKKYNENFKKDTEEKTFKQNLDVGYTPTVGESHTELSEGYTRNMEIYQ